MADYREKFDEWQQAARRKARELDEKFAISDIVGESARAAGEAAKRARQTRQHTADRRRRIVGQLVQRFRRLFRDHYRVTDRQRRDVEERQHLRVLVEFVTRDFAA